MIDSRAAGSARYRAFRALMRAWYHNVLHLTVDGIRYVPASGPVVLACNHPCAVDGMLLLTILPRRVTGILTAEDVPLARWGKPSSVLGFPLVPRAASDADARRRHLAGVRVAGELLRRGWVFCALPEGDVNPAPALAPFASTFVFLAADAGAPIVPVAIVGTDKALAAPARPGTFGQLMLRRTRVHVSFLAPEQVDGLPSRRDAERITNDIRARVQAAADAARTRIRVPTSAVVRQPAG